MTTDTNEVSSTPRTDDQFRDATKMVPTVAKSATPPKQKKCTFCGGEGWWMDAMGTNSYRCDKCQNPAVSDHIVEANKMVPVVKESLTTQIDTPRTDAASFSSRDPLELLQTSQQLERELAISLENQCKVQAEVERLTKRPFGCKCETFREKALGDGCEECNKALVIEMLTDERDELKTENAKLREIVERYRVWATSENPTELELRHLKQKYDELN
jgi:hypothetical protein